MRVFSTVISFLTFFPGVCFATYTPLVSSTTFDGVRADVTTTAVGIISVLIIIVGVALIARAFTR
jgi:hypothetical protein